MVRGATPLASLVQSDAGREWLTDSHSWTRGEAKCRNLHSRATGSSGADKLAVPDQLLTLVVIEPMR
jgi:hypothetical protein